MMTLEEKQSSYQKLKKKNQELESISEKYGII